MRCVELHFWILDNLPLAAAVVVVVVVILPPYHKTIRTICAWIRFTATALCKLCNSCRDAPLADCCSQRDAIRVFALSRCRSSPLAVLPLPAAVASRFCSLARLCRLYCAVYEWKLPFYFFFACVYSTRLKYPGKNGNATMCGAYPKRRCANKCALCGTTTTRKPLVMRDITY